MSLREDRRLQVREQLLDATMQVIVEGGWDGISTDVIASRAGLSRATLFNYFPRREELVLELVRRRLCRMETELAELAQTKPQLSRAKAIIRIFEEYAAQNERLPEVLRLAFMKLAGSSTGRSVLHPFIASLQRLLENFLMGGGVPVAEAKSLAGLTTAVYFGSQIEWMMDADHKPGHLQKTIRARLRIILKEHL